MLPTLPLDDNKEIRYLFGWNVSEESSTVSLHLDGKLIDSVERFEYIADTSSHLLILTLWTLHSFEFLSFFAKKRWSISSKDRGWLLVAEVVESYLECWTNTTFKCDVNKIGQVLDKSVLPTLANSEPKLWDFGYQKWHQFRLE